MFAVLVTLIAAVSVQAVPGVADDTIEMILRVETSKSNAPAIQDLMQQIHDITIENADAHGVRYFAQASGALNEGLLSTREGYSSAAGVAQHLADVGHLLDSIQDLAEDSEVFFTAPASETESLQSLGYDVWTLGSWSMYRPDAIGAQPGFVGVSALYVVTNLSDFDETFGGIAREAAANEPGTVQFGIAFKENTTGTYAWFREGYADPASDHTHFLAIKPLIDSGVFSRSWSVSPFSRIYATEAQMDEEQTVRSPTEGICAIKRDGCDFFTLSNDIFVNVSSGSLLV